MDITYKIKLATLIIIIKIQYSSAQLFPWSNLKQYFDQKTKNGPGNGGLLNITPDINDPVNADESSLVGERPYRHTDSNTGLVLHDEEVESQTDVSLDTITPDQDILKINRNKNKINFDFNEQTENKQKNNDNHEKTTQNISWRKKLLKPVLSLNQDSTIRPYRDHPPPIIHLRDNPKHVEIQDNYESPTQSTIVITQKPISSLHNDYRPNNNRISHKTVSILPSTNTKSQTFVNNYDEDDYNDNNNNNNKQIYVTSRPDNYQTTQLSQYKLRNSISTHRPLRPNMVNARPSNVQFNNKPTAFLPTIPPTKNSNFKSSTQSNIIINNKQPIKKEKEEIFVETVPSLGIQIKTSNNNKPFRITDGTSNKNKPFRKTDANGSGLVDYLIPPPLEPLQYREPIQFRKPFRSNLSPGFIKNLSSLSALSTEQNSKTKTNENQQNIYNEMSKISPQKREEKFNLPNKKLQNYLNVIKQQQLLQEQSQIVNPPQQSRISRNPNVNPFVNHKMPGQQTGYDNRQYEFKDDKHLNQYSAASHVNEQITLGTSYQDLPHSEDGQRVEFQMHGQNGPKSYKFGFDTGKGHNRQFRYEERDKDGYVKGHYGYYDKEGKLQVVNYEADPHTGFKAEPII